jgi:hypothetical protein
MSYALDFPSGKKWIADQLDSIATRYLNRNARVVAEMVRESMQSSIPSLKFITAMKPEHPPTLGGQAKVVVPEQESWAHSMNEPDLYQTFLSEDKRSSSVGGMRDPSGAKVEEIYPSEPVVWDARLH